MATILTDPFNNYNNGALNGQGSWSGSNDFVVQESVKKEGAKAIEIESTSSLGVERTGIQVVDGKVTVYLRINDTNGTNARAYFILNEGATNCIYTQLYYNNFNYHTGSSWVNVVTGLGTNTWHCIQIEWRDSDKKVRYRVNEGAWTSWVVMYSSFSSYIDKVCLNSSPLSGTTTVYFDYVAEHAYSEHYEGILPSFRKPI